MAEEKQVEQTTTPVVEEQPTEQPTETVNSNTFSQKKCSCGAMGING